jgi:hypothetical protein
MVDKAESKEVGEMVVTEAMPAMQGQVEMEVSYTLYRVECPK